MAQDSVQVNKYNQIQGDTFRIIMDMQKDKTPLDITDWEITGQIKQGATLVSELTVEIIDPLQGQYTAFVLDTSKWPVGDLVCYLRYTLPSGDKISGPPFYVSVQRGGAL